MTFKVGDLVYSEVFTANGKRRQGVIIERAKDDEKCWLVKPDGFSVVMIVHEHWMHDTDRIMTDTREYLEAINALVRP